MLLTIVDNFLLTLFIKLRSLTKGNIKKPLTKRLEKVGTCPVLSWNVSSPKFLTLPFSFMQFIILYPYFLLISYTHFLIFYISLIHISLFSTYLLYTFPYILLFSYTHLLTFYLSLKHISLFSTYLLYTFPYFLLISYTNSLILFKFSFTFPYFLFILYTHFLIFYLSLIHIS